MAAMTWRELIAKQPEFGSWVVQRHGPLPEGPVDPELVLDYFAEYLKEQGYGIE